MKDASVKIGGIYVASVDRHQTTVYIESVSDRGGWIATDRTTQKRVRIQARQLRYIDNPNCRP